MFTCYLIRFSMNFVSITTIFNLVVEFVKLRENDMGVTCPSHIYAFYATIKY
jgi:uncharacterized protein YhbP (UPF0306 family)